MAHNRIAIMAPGNYGDVCTAMSVLKYKDVLWPGKEIWWFCSPEESDCLKYAPVEIKIWEDFSSLIINKNNKSKYKELKESFTNLKEIDREYYPLPWMYEVHEPVRRGVDYPNISRKVFGVPANWEWHPMLYFSNEEREMVRDFCLSLPHKKTIMLETGSRSKQSAWNKSMTAETMRLCREKLGKCNFIFASKQNNPEFFDDPSNGEFFDEAGVVSCSHFTVRQSALVNNYCDLFIGISSGISVATSCWGNKPTPKIQYTNTFTCSTVSIANGPIDLIEIHALKDPEAEYYRVLRKWLDQI